MITEDVNEIRKVLNELAKRAMHEYDMVTLSQIENADASLDAIVSLYDELRALNHEHVMKLEEQA